MVDGYNYVDRISWEPYNKSKNLIDQIERYKERFGYYPEWVSADKIKIYGTRENRAYMKECGIKFTGVALGRPRKELGKEMKEKEIEKKKKGKQRSQIEGVFGVGKRKYGLGLVKAKTQQTAEVWIGSVCLEMNIAQFFRVIFWPFLKS